MKRTMTILLVAILALGAANCNRKPKTSCVYGDKIPATVLDPVVQMGNTLSIALEQDRFDDIYNTAVDMFKKVQTPEQFKLILQSMKANLGPLEFSKLNEAWYLTNKAGKKYPTVTVACNLQEKADDFYQVPRNSEVVALIYNVRAGEESAEIFIELIKEGPAWKLLSLVLSPTTFRGKNVDGYVKLAREARGANKLKLALMYYKIAYLLSNLSPNVDEYVARRTAAELAQVRTDYMPAGQAQLWNIAGDYKPQVFNVDVLFSKGEPWVNIDWLAESLEDTPKLEIVSQGILDFVLKNSPEFKDFFAGIIVSARSQEPKQANQAYRKIYRYPESPGK
jgi:hypothetical protein